MFSFAVFPRNFGFPGTSIVHKQKLKSEHPVLCDNWTGVSMGIGTLQPCKIMSCVMDEQIPPRGIFDTFVRNNVASSSRHPGHYKLSLASKSTLFSSLRVIKHLNWTTLLYVWYILWWKLPALSRYPLMTHLWTDLGKQPRFKPTHYWHLH